MSRSQPLPDELGYLQPFVNWLGKYSPDGLNEDIDAARLERALRRRVRGLSVLEAQRRLAADREALRSWLESSAPQGHPAQWVLGFLSHPKLAKELLEPAPGRPPEPLIEFEPPAGWRVRVTPFNLNLRKGKPTASITLINEFSFRNLQVPGSQRFPPGEGRVEEQAMQFGEVKGTKYWRIQTAPVPSRQMDYVLEVPGGFVNIVLRRADGQEFDEQPFEAQLGTLRLAEPGGNQD
jgi:hypothetical protein